MIELTPHIIALTVFSGALVGMLLGVFGGGGSVLAAPLLLYVVGVSDAHVALGTASAAVAVNAGINLIGHNRAGRVKWPCASVFAAAGLLGAFAGSSLAKMIDGRALLIGFAGAMAVIALSMLRPAKGEGDPAVRLDAALMMRLAPMGVGVGFAAGFFGIGGGFLIVPGMMMATGMTIAHASASSLVSVALFGAATASNYAVSHLVDWRLVGLLIAGGVAGGAAGLALAKMLSTSAASARSAFAVFVLCAAFYVAWRAIAG